jgi:hypothetical protein
MNRPLALPVSPSMLDAMGDAIAAVADMAEFSRGVFARFFADFPDEAPRFLNLNAAVLRMTDETLALLLDLAGGGDWAPHGAEHWADLHRNYGRIASDRYRAWVALCITELAALRGGDWDLSAAGWQAAADALSLQLEAANARIQGTSQPADH